MVDSFQAFIQALGNFGTIGIWIWIVVGTVAGLIVGIIPGIGSLAGLALILPFAFKMTPLEAMPLMVALASVGFTGGSITAILLGIPGEPSNAATILDGFPMNQKGQGARAIGAALLSSLLGGVAPAFLAVLMVFIILPIVMALTSMEMVFIILIGLACIGIVGRGSNLKGLISGGVGLLLSGIGLSVASGEPRYTFDNAFLYEGLHMVPVALGLFAVPPMIELAMQQGGETLAKGGYIFKGIGEVWKGAMEVFKHKLLWLKSSLIGYIFGILPGVGAVGAVFVAYSQAKQTSKHPELFGTGVIEGIIAPESCNNAKESGSLLTTLALGMPGSGTGALMMGGLMIMGLKPGPSMITEHLDLSLTLLLVVAIANIIGAAICFPLATQLAKIATVPGRILVPIVLAIIFTGSFTDNGQIGDVLVLVIFSVVGVFIQKYGYNAPALFLGFVLGALFENYLFVALQLGGPFFFLRPICLLLIFVTIAVFTYSPIKARIKQRLNRT